MGYLLESLGDSGLGRDSNPRRDVVLSERTLSLAPRPLERARAGNRPARPPAIFTPPCFLAFCPYHSALPARRHARPVNPVPKTLLPFLFPFRDIHDSLMRATCIP